MNCPYCRKPLVTVNGQSHYLTCPAVTYQTTPDAKAHGRPWHCRECGTTTGKVYGTNLCVACAPQMPARKKAAKRRKK